MEDEGVVFEGLRLGSTQAFGEVLDSYDASMRRLARLYVPEDQVGALLRQTWSTALPGLDMFTWHTTLRAWVTGIFVTYGRAWRSSAAGTAPATAAHTWGPAPGPATARAPDRAEVSPDPVPWGSLGWSGRWGPDGWQLLEDVMAIQPLDVREVLWLRDVEAWPWREVLDALGLTAAQGRELLVAGRTALAAVVADHVGADPDPHGEGRLRTDGVATLLASLRPVHPPPVVDRDLQRLFATWRRQRGVRPWHRWRWELTRRRDR